MIQKRLNPLIIPGPDEDPKKRPRLSIYWIYGIIFAAIIGYNLYQGTMQAAELKLIIPSFMKCLNREMLTR